MKSIIQPYRGVSSLWQLTSGCISTVLLLSLLLPTTPVLAGTSTILIFEASYSTGDGKIVAQDCLRLSVLESSFQSDRLRSLRFPAGRWGFDTAAEGMVFTAFLNRGNATKSIPTWVSLGGHIDATMSTMEAVYIQSNGLQLHTLAIAVDSCNLPASASQKEAALAPGPYTKPNPTTMTPSQRKINAKLLRLDHQVRTKGDSITEAAESMGFMTTGDGVLLDIVVDRKAVDLARKLARPGVVLKHVSTTYGRVSASINDAALLYDLAELPEVHMIMPEYGARTYDDARVGRLVGGTRRGDNAMDQDG